MVKKSPRRTAERILEISLALFNRYGEPNVSTTLISSELNISPGNLYYHFPAKDKLVNVLFDRYEIELHRLLSAATQVADIENAWFFMHSLFELVWQYRFLYRDVNDLLTKNRRLETHVKDALLHKKSAFKSLLQGLESSHALKMDADERGACATHMVVVLTWWLSFEYVKDPRHTLEDASAVRAVMRGAQGVLGLLLPYLQSPHKDHLRGILRAYQS